MSDQAEKLRQLVQAQQQGLVRGRGAERLIVLAGCQAGVGTSTLAVNLAVALKRRGASVALIDTSATGKTTADLCRLRTRYRLQEVMRGRRKLREVLDPGPCGIHVAAGVDLPGPAEPAERERLLTQLTCLARQQFVLVDTGDPAWGWQDALCPLAAHVLVIARGEPGTTDAYLHLKQRCGRFGKAQLSLVLNQVRDEADAQELERRIQLACDRFLNLSLAHAAVVRYDEHVLDASHAGRPVLLCFPHAPVSRAVDHLASWLEQQQRVDLRQQNLIA